MKDAYMNNLEADDLRLAGEAAKVLEVVVQLVHFNILEGGQEGHVPSRAAQVVLTHCVLDHVELAANFHCVSLWNDDDLAELAHDVSFIDLPDCLVSFNFLVQSEVLVLFADDEWLDHLGLLFLVWLFLFVWFFWLTFVLDVASFWGVFTALFKFTVLLRSLSVSEFSLGINNFGLLLLLCRFCHFSNFSLKLLKFESNLN